MPLCSVSYQYRPWRGLKHGPGPDWRFPVPRKVQICIKRHPLAVIGFAARDSEQWRIVVSTCDGCRSGCRFFQFGVLEQ